LRYALNNEDSDILQNMDSDKWKEYYKFTFVRNPYEKFYSILSCYKNKKFNDDKNSFHSDKNSLLENKDLCSNYMHCMTFINQYEHLLDYSENLNMQFIGSVEYLDRDLLIILNQLGVKDVKHFQYLEKNNKNSFYYYDNITYKLIKEDNIQHKLLSSISKDRTLMDWKYRTKINIIKQIKSRSLWKSIPESITIQNVLNLLYPSIFSCKDHAKYFLTLIGDNILKKNTGDLIFLTKTIFFSIAFDVKINFYVNWSQKQNAFFFHFFCIIWQKNHKMTFSSILGPYYTEKMLFLVLTKKLIFFGKMT
jgi:hypothetical protein